MTVTCQETTDFEVLERENAEGVLRWAVERFHPRLALSAAFGVECVALIDMLVRIQPDVRVFTLDTGRLPQETYALMDRVREKYGVRLEVCFPDTAKVEEMVRAKGVNLFLNSVEDRKLCCNIRKVLPLNRALTGLDAWITGLRRDQALTRTRVPKVAVDHDHGDIVKISPLADWTVDQVWDYVRKNDVPYNPLHDQGYPSLGCACCTRAIKPGEDIRAGRWWWESPEQKECGLHCSGGAKASHQ